MQENDGKSEKGKIVLDNVMTAMILTDKNLDIVYCNPYTNRLLGYLPEELLGKNIIILMDREVIDKHDYYINKLSNSIINITKRELGVKMKHGKLAQCVITIKETEKYYIISMQEMNNMKNELNKMVNLNYKGELIYEKKKMSIERFVDVDEMRQITMGDKKMSDELMDMYLGDLRQNIPIIEELYQKGDLKGCQMLGHCLRGASCQLGFTKLMEDCRKIEDEPTLEAIKSLKKSYQYLIKKEKDISEKIVHD